MNLKFSAKSTSYQEALGGDIVQIGFEEDPDDDPINPRSKSICASINYECSPCELVFEWMNGSKFEGGLKERDYSISEKRFSVTLEGGMVIDIEHSADAETYHRISTFLLREAGPPKNA